MKISFHIRSKRNHMDEQKFLENFKKRVIKDTIKILCKNYSIYDSNENQIDEKELVEKILTPKIIKRCIGTTSTSPISQCTRNSVENYNYCKTHLYKMCLEDNSKFEIHSLPQITLVQGYSDTYQHMSNLTKKFIEDSFYYVDNKYIYDMNMSKVGYIEENDNYILTSDPFVLEMM